MNILIDTHIALWSMYDSDKLNDKAKECLCASNNIIFVSHASVWEIAIKQSLGKLSVPADEFLQDCSSMGFLELPICRQHIFTVQHMSQGPYGHMDPFDRMLLAQANTERMSFLTNDKAILRYDLSFLIQ